ncbi:MAG: Na+/H+ antiporter NhaA [Myxococcaceae bacterium]|nr:Na+/H+ antiporter NhaA [Myxococcaceae bacterium]
MAERIQTTGPAGPLFRAVIAPLQAFFRFEAAGGVLLLVTTLVALAWANSPWKDAYHHLFSLPFEVTVGGVAVHFSFEALINDGLMTIFFFVVGMEIKRELLIGELRSYQRALLPAVAALGGMIAPAVIYAAINWGTPELRGWAIPMATDIAFSLGVLTVLKKHVPWSLIVFLTALAIFDDMGGIAVIALFYGTGIHWPWLAVAALFTLTVAAVGRGLIVRNGLAWGVVGVALWYTVHRAGIHPTIAGVLLGLLIPARSAPSGREILASLSDYLQQLLARPTEEEISQAEVLEIEERLEDLEPPLNRFVHLLHPYVAFGIVPLFALTNAGVDLSGVSLHALARPVPLGIALGLFLGKQLGIFGFTVLALRTRLSPMPTGGRAYEVWGVSAVGGIGFTVALFVATLAFRDAPQTLAEAKLGILVGSAASALFGFLLLWRGGKALATARN